MKEVFNRLRVGVLTEVDMKKLSMAFSSDLFGYSSIKNVIFTHVIPCETDLVIEYIPLSPSNESTFMLRAKLSPRNYGDAN
jgi:hypothetical protein